MKAILCAVLLLGLSGCQNDELPHVSSSAEGSVPLTDSRILTVDEDNQEFEAELVRWRFLSKDVAWNILQCDESKCSEWRLLGEIAQPIEILATGSIVKPDDSDCWSLFFGQRTLERIDPEIRLVLSYKNTACK